MGKVTKINFSDLQIISTSQYDEPPFFRCLKVKHIPTGREVDYEKFTKFQDIGFERAVLAIVKEVEGDDD